MNKQATGINPGLLYVISKIVQPESLTPERYTDWYEKIHVPDVLKTSGIDEAVRWQALDPSAERPYLALYPLQDLDFLHSPEFAAIPVDHDSLPGSKNIFDLANFDTRYYRFVQRFEPEVIEFGIPNLVISAEFTPADDKDYEHWYQQEHLEEMSKISSWCKTERYELTKARENRFAPGEQRIPYPPKYLTLHFFDGDTLPEQELAKASESEWTKRSMSTMKEAKIMPFKKLSSFRK